MKYGKILSGIVIGLFSFLGSTFAQTVWSENFNGMSTGSKFLNVKQTKVLSSGGVGGGKCLEVEYDLHKSNGSTRLLAKKSIPRAKEYTLNYDIFFTNDWNRTTGGKFHGLVPENTTSGCKPIEKDGWSCRAVFANRNPYLYTYHQDKNSSCGDKNGNGAQLQKNKWYSVSLHMKVNSKDNVKDGFARLYIDGKLVAEQKNREFRSTINSNTEITKFYFSTFLGGGPSGGVTQRMHARFDNFAIVKGQSIRQKPGGGSTGGPTVGCPEAPKDNWMDSYSANGKCWVESQYDHGINNTTVTINGKGYLVKDIAEELTKHPDYRTRRSTDPIYNDVQCGNGPANNAGDEDCCPGRVDQGRSGCNTIGPKWDITWLSTRTRFGGGAVNQKPSVTVTSPNNNQTFTLGQTINMTANASDADGSIDRVNFKVNGKYHSQDKNGNPYNSTFKPTITGTYTIGARAFDNTGAATEKAVTITVVSAQPKDCAGVPGGSATTVCGVCIGGTTGKSAPDADGDGIVDCDDECPNDATNKCNEPTNQAPTLSFNKPLNGYTYEVGTTLIANVNASDADGDISNVKLYINGSLVRQENFAPYDWNHKEQDPALQNMTAGTYTLKAIATDDDGGSSETSITITIEDEQLPKDCAGVPGGSATTVCGVCVGGTTGKSAPDADGDGIIDCEDECPNDPSNTCNDPTNQAPIVSFTKPVNGDTYDEGTTLIANVNASDADGDISNVKLYINGSLVRQENFAPYDWNHKGQDAALQNMSAGTYTLKALATDNDGAVAERTIQITIEKEDIVVTPDDGPIIGDDCAVKNGMVSYEVSSDIKKNATNYSWWFSGSSSSVISPANAPHTVDITMSQYYKGGEVCVGVNSNVAPFYTSYCKSVGVCSGGEELETSDVSVNEYPNPIEGNLLIIEVSDNAGEILEVSILSSAGDILLDTNKLLDGGKIDLSNVPAGSHILRVVTEGGIVNKRIIKL